VARDLLVLFSLPLIVPILPRPAKDEGIQELSKSKHKRLSRHQQNFAEGKSLKGSGIESEK
jgi:hypothetical protein